MANFRLTNPDAVFIHICKTGGTSIRRGVWVGKFERSFGCIPSDWRPLFKFAFVRHPFDRLVSAWKMFTDGVHDSPAAKTFPGLTGMPLRRFLDIVTDDSIGYDTSKPNRTVAVQVRHHTIPQTHPFNCLHDADFVGRYENLENDFSTVARRLGVTKELPHLHRTIRGDWKQYFGSEEAEVATRFYKEDFEKLSY